MTANEDRRACIQEVGEALRGNDDYRQRMALNNERVRIATALLRFGKFINDPHVMVDALLAAVSQTVAEHGIDPLTVQNDFVIFVAAAQRDLMDRRGAESHEAPSTTDPTRNLN